MAALRRSLIGFIALLAMLCGACWTAAAYACPDPSISRPADDSCGHHKPAGGALPSCGPVCLGVAVAVPSVVPAAPIHAPSYTVMIAELQSHAFAPDPPPPRAAQA